MTQREIKFRAWDKYPKYEIGNDGSVYSLNYKNRGIRMRLKHSRPTKRKDAAITFVVNQIRVTESVKHLVASAFVPNPNGYTDVIHIDGNKENLSAENLAWASRSEVCKLSFANGRKHTAEQISKHKQLFSGCNNPKAKLNEAEALSIKRLREKGVSLKEIAERHSISKAQVSAIANGKFWK